MTHTNFSRIVVQICRQPPAPLSLLFSLALGMCMVGCTTSPSSQDPVDAERVSKADSKPDSAIESAVKAPLVDLNVVRKKIPKVLETARKAPYAMPEDRRCSELATEIAELNRALGTDLDAPKTSRRSLAKQGSDEASKAAAGAMEDLATGWIPYRSWVRRLTGAERHSKVVAKAIQAGLVRRAFLKGIGEQAHCAFPASPLTPVAAGSWRFTHALPAPWDPENPLGPDLRGEVIKISESAFQGPAYLHCEPAEFTRLSMPAEGLFEGGLPAPAQTTAQNLGIAHFPVATTRVTCANGSFDLHQVDSQTMLIGLDNRVWTLVHSAGTDSVTSTDDNAAGIVQLLLETHFSGEMGFIPEALDTKSTFLSTGLRHAITAYFAVPRPADEVPPINGDPFTDSQEYPTRFLVSRATGDDTRASVEVTFASGWSNYPLIYRLVREANGWKLDDIVYGNGYTFLNLLTMP